MSEPRPPTTPSSTGSSSSLEYAFALLVLSAAALAFWLWFGSVLADIARIASSSGGPMSLAVR